MTDSFEVKKKRVITHFGGPRATMERYLAHLEKIEKYEFCVEIRNRIRRYDAGDENAFEGFI